MIVYFDTSALIPLVIEEPSSRACEAIWTTADDVASSHLAVAEGAAALAAARRAGRIDRNEHGDATARLNDIWSELLVVAVDQSLLNHAAALCNTHPLRGYDAVHCASAIAVQDVDLVAAAGDRRLLDAWHDLGIATVDINA